MSKTQVSQQRKHPLVIRILFILVALFQIYVMIDSIHVNRELGRPIDWLSYIPNIGLALILLIWAFINEQFFIRGDERLDAIRHRAIYLTFYFMLGYIAVMYTLTLLAFLPLTANQVLMLLLYMGCITLQIIHSILLKKA
ncbi:hypothetical protein [Paenibacillus wulumuqiensis]|uniref:hypothetical protein n=1 Tax=Paenibacillus wulumuqiensis TaxID=1567107 RepID=UPI0006191A16|nr:hypothetical protein [Paenibacillus wulumuqiensis]